MRLLLDTHIALWAITDDPLLSARARLWIADPANEIYISAATVWEIAIKHALGPGRRSAMPISGTTASARFAAAGYVELPITAAHAARVDTLPLLHQDPFDRLLVAQALHEQLSLLTHDALLASYGDTILV